MQPNVATPGSALAENKITLEIIARHHLAGTNAVGSKA
jgi:hypothetical protein